MEGEGYIPVAGYRVYSLYELLLLIYSVAVMIIYVR